MAYFKDYKYELDPHRLNKLLDTAEEFLAMIMEYDPIKERSNRICRDIRNAVNCYSVMRKEKVHPYVNAMNINSYDVNYVSQHQRQPEVTYIGQSQSCHQQQLTYTDSTINYTNNYVNPCKETTESRIESLQPHNSTSVVPQYHLYSTDHQQQPQQKIHNVRQHAQIKSENADEELGSLIIAENSNLEENEVVKMEEETWVLKGNYYSFTKDPNGVLLGSSSNEADASFQHELIDGETFYRCSKCDFQTSCKETLRQHMIAAHGKAKPYKCEDCEYRCSQRATLKRHKMCVHEGLKPYKCSQCEYKCSQRTNLNKHVLSVHERVKPLKCPTCSRQFSFKQQLKQHMYNHDEVKRFKCSKCEYQFSQKGSLNRHMLAVHDKIKPFKCTICGYVTSLKGNLDKHVSIHAKVKPFRCHLCEYQSCQKNSLKHHLSAIHGDNLI